MYILYSNTLSITSHLCHNVVITTPEISTGWSFETSTDHARTNWDRTHNQTEWQEIQCQWEATDSKSRTDMVYWRSTMMMCAQVALSGECLRGKGRSDRILAKSWRRLFLAAYTFWAKPGCYCPAWQSVSCHCCNAWQTVVCCILCVRSSGLS